MQKFTAIQVKTLSATNTRGTRVKLVQDKKNVILPFDYRFNTSMDVAINYLKEKNIDIIQFIHMKNNDIILINSDFSL